MSTSRVSTNRGDCRVRFAVSLEASRAVANATVNCSKMICGQRTHQLSAAGVALNLEMPSEWVTAMAWMMAIEREWEARARGVCVLAGAEGAHCCDLLAHIVR